MEQPQQRASSSFAELRAEYELQLAQMVENEERAAKAKLTLIEITKNLKKSSDEEKLKTMDSVLKAYQSEINKLVARAKFAEGAFGSLYKHMLEAPDPAALLRQAETDKVRVAALEAELKEVTAQLQADKTRIASLETELSKAKLQIQEYDREFQTLKNQDVTIRRLEAEKKELEAKLERSVAELAKEYNKELNEEIDELKRLLAEQERVHHARLEAAKEELTRALQANERTQSELLALNARFESVEVSREREREMYTAEIEQLQDLVASLRGQLADQEQKILLVQQTGPSSQRSKETEEEVQQLRLALEASEEQLRLQTAAWREERQALKEQAKQAQQKSEKCEAELAALQAELKSRPTLKQYQSLQKQLRLLQEAEFGAVADLEEGEQGSTVSSNNDEFAPSPGEQLLLRKLRQLEAEVTRHKIEASEHLAASQRLRSELETTQAQLSAAQRLNQQLEAQLMVLAAQTQHQGMKGHVRQASADLPASAAVSPPLSPSSSSPDTASLATSSNGSNGTPAATSIIPVSPAVLSSLPSPASSHLTSNGSGSGSGASQEVSLLAIVTAQRDRFRRQVEELEKEVSQQQDRISNMAAEIETLKAENLRLFEKTKLIGQFSKESKANRYDLELGLGSQASNRKAASDAETERKYERLYEEKVNPFKEFKLRQQEERYKNLSVSEKALYHVGKVLVSKEFARTFAFVYALILHFLVFITLVTHTVTSHCG